MLETSSTRPLAGWESARRFPSVLSPGLTLTLHEGAGRKGLSFSRHFSARPLPAVHREGGDIPWGGVAASGTGNTVQAQGRRDSTDSTGRSGSVSQESERCLAH